MKDTRLTKWKYGLLVVGIVSVGLIGYTLYQGVRGRVDKQTYKKAQDIASKLNNYVNNEQKLPVTLQDAHITDVPGTISYTKQSSDKYEFCVTYKLANIDVGSSVTDELTKAAYGGYSSSDTSYDDSSYSASELYISGTHKAGKQCQTVKPYISSYDDSYYNNYDDYGSGSDGVSIDYDSNTFQSQ